MNRISLLLQDHSIARRGVQPGHLQPRDPHGRWRNEGSDSWLEWRKTVPGRRDEAGSMPAIEKRAVPEDDTVRALSLREDVLPQLVEAAQRLDRRSFRAVAALAEGISCKLKVQSDLWGVEGTLEFMRPGPPGPPGSPCQEIGWVSRITAPLVAEQCGSGDLREEDQLQKIVWGFLSVLTTVASLNRPD